MNCTVEAKRAFSGWIKAKYFATSPTFGKERHEWAQISLLQIKDTTMLTACQLGIVQTLCDLESSHGMTLNDIQIIQTPKENSHTLLLLK